jgi:hypothetical protein
VNSTAASAHSPPKIHDCVHDVYATDVLPPTIQHLFQNLKSIYVRPICVFHWKTLNRRFGIHARHKSLSHDFREVNDVGAECSPDTN